jgi:hypothetical protein
MEKIIFKNSYRKTKKSLGVADWLAEFLLQVLCTAANDT